MHFVAPPSWAQTSSWRSGPISSERLSHTKHVVGLLVGSIPPVPNGSGVRAALTNNKLERWRENNSNISAFLSSEQSFWTGKIGQVRGELLGRGWKPVLKEGLQGNKGEEGLYVCSFSTNIFLAIVIIRHS